jgi:hypothetical protein
MLEVAFNLHWTTLVSSSSIDKELPSKGNFASDFLGVD